MASHIDFVQLNMQHSRQATDAFCRMFSKLQTSIALLQEPWVHGNCIRGITKGCGRLFVGSSETRPRTCLCVRGDIDAWLLPQVSSADVTAVRAELQLQEEKIKVIIASLYLPFDLRTVPPSNELLSLMEYSKQTKIPVLIGCDANSHHTLWGSSDINNRGRALLEFCLSSGLEILNVGQEPTFINSLRKEVIDITLASMSLSDTVTSWHVSEEVSFSDHRYICFQMVSKSNSDKYKRDPRKTNWTHYRSLLSESLVDQQVIPKSILQLENCVSEIQSSVVDSFCNACPLQKILPGKSVPWWNKDLTKLRKKARRLLRIALITEAKKDWINYRSIQNKFKKSSRKAKRVGWQNFCEKAENQSSSVRLYKLLSRDSNTQVGMFQLADGEFTNTPTEALSHLLATHFPGSAAQEAESAGMLVSEQVGEDWDLADSIIRKESVIWAVNVFDPFKSPGPDGIMPVLLQNGIDIIAEHLVGIFKACIALGHIPVSWRMAQVIFIPKPGKINYYLAKSFRPISLMSFLLKTLERIVDRYLRDTVLKIYSLHKN